MRSDDPDNVSTHATVADHVFTAVKGSGRRLRDGIGHICLPGAETIDYADTPLPAEPTLLPTDYQGRKDIPVATGVLDYFPAALIEIAKVSKAGNDQHNPGEELHWARGKSMDQSNTLLRHFMERGTIDTDGVRHSAKMVWRALALLQLELEAAGLAPIARGARQA